MHTAHTADNRYVAMQVVWSQGSKYDSGISASLLSLLTAKTGTPDQQLFNGWTFDLILLQPLKYPLEIWSPAGQISVLTYRRGPDASKDFAIIINKVLERKNTYRDQR